MITTPDILRRGEDGTWTAWDTTIRPGFDFNAEDGADRDTLTEWLTEFVADNGEGEWAATYNGIKSKVVTTGPTTDDVYRIAIDAAGSGNVELVADDCGWLTLVAVLTEGGSVADGAAMMVIGAERDGGYTWTTYSAAEYDHQPMMEREITTDGDTTVGSLANAIRVQVAK